MHVTKITPISINRSGRLIVGLAHFSDGKIWKFSTKNWNIPIFYVDSGKGGQESMYNFEKCISPPKRVAALKTKLIEMKEDLASYE